MARLSVIVGRKRKSRDAVRAHAVAGRCTSHEAFTFIAVRVGVGGTRVLVVGAGPLHGRACDAARVCGRRTSHEALTAAAVRVGVGGTRGVFSGVSENGE